MKLRGRIMTTTGRTLNRFRGTARLLKLAENSEFDARAIIETRRQLDIAPSSESISAKAELERTGIPKGKLVIVPPVVPSL